MVIESFSNPKYKYLLSLSKSKTRKKDGVYLMEGRTEIELAIRSGQQPQIVAYSEAYIDQKGIESVVGGSPHQFIKLSKALFDALSYQNVPLNFIGVFPAFTNELAMINDDEPIVILEKVEKPGNLGAILRTCDALGVKNLIATNSPVDLFNPNILRNSRGAIFSTTCVFAENEEVLQFLKDRKSLIYSAALTDGSEDYRKVKLKNNNAYVFGSEANGLSDFWLSNADQNIIIPMKGQVDSLNVSVSVAIILSHHFNALLSS